MFYVYVYWRLDTNEVFYVGKGTRDRWKRLSRNYNPHFMNIVNKYPIAVEIIKDNLTEEEAFYWEENIIDTLVFEYGYSIDIKHNRGDKHSPHLTNMTWGGEGTRGHYSMEGKSEEEIRIRNENLSKAKTGVPLSKFHRDRISHATKGEKNHFYGKRHTGETKLKISQANKGNNAFDVMSEEQIIEWKRKHSEQFTGDKNPMAKSVICITTKRIFTTAKEGAEYYGIKHQGDITVCCKGYKMRKGKKEKRHYAGKLPNGTPLKWKFLRWKHDKKYRINLKNS